MILSVKEYYNWLNKVKKEESKKVTLIATPRLFIAEKKIKESVKRSIR
jgi:hypothetical protein